MTEKFPWQELYKSAMLELNALELRNKLKLAGAAMRERAKQLAEFRDDASREEKRALADALSNLAVLERMEEKRSSQPGPSTYSAPQGGDRANRVP